MNNTKAMRTSLTIKYSILQGLYWMIYCAMYGFASSFLLGSHFNNKAVGTITAIANIMAVFFQPLLGNFVSKNNKLTVKGLLTQLALGTLVMNVLLITFILVVGESSKNQILIAIMFTIGNLIMLTIQPFINSLIYEYINRGVEVNYGATRGVGSLSYALISYILGQLLNDYAVIVLPVVAAALLVVFIIVVQLFPKVQNDEQVEVEKQEVKESNYLEFLTKYKALIPFLIAVVLVYVTHTYLNTFMLQILESLKGSAANAELGNATLISALSELPIMFAFAYIVRYVKGSTLLKWSAFFYVVRCVIALVAQDVTMIYVSQAFQALSFALFTPASVYYINKIVNDEDKVRGQTVMLGATTLGGVIGNFTGGIILDITGVQLLLFVGLATAALAIIFYMLASKKDNIK